MFVMQKMTPTAMDPAQQRIMMIMPVVLVVMFFAAPGGPEPVLAGLEPVLDRPAGGHPAACCGAQDERRPAPARSDGGMKDRSSTGATWRRRWRPPPRALGLPADALRYVVLERGHRGGAAASAARRRGSRCCSRRAAAAAAPRPAGGRRPRRAASRRRRRRRATLAAGSASSCASWPRPPALDLTAEVDETDEGAACVRLGGPGATSSWRTRARSCEALEHLLQRMYAPGARAAPAGRGVRGLPRRTATTRLRERGPGPGRGGARATARPRETAPLNSYERRIVHVALAEAPGRAHLQRRARARTGG